MGESSWGFWKLDTSTSENLRSGGTHPNCCRLLMCGDAWQREILLNSPTKSFVRRRCPTNNVLWFPFIWTGTLLMLCQLAVSVAAQWKKSPFWFSCNACFSTSTYRAEALGCCSSRSHTFPRSHPEAATVGQDLRACRCCCDIFEWGGCFWEPWHVTCVTTHNIPPPLLVTSRGSSWAQNKFLHSLRIRANSQDRRPGIGGTRIQKKLKWVS